MCDLTTVDYQKGDVVWVKLGSLWWPGLVHDYDSLPEDIKADTQAFKKQPIAYVKFFQEENFEYVKDIHSIYHYNCLKKKEFIKKGLDMMRSTRISTSNMQLFPSDVITAENLTQGDPKILDRPEFSPEEEAGKAVYEDLFSTPNQKKLKKKKDGKDSSPVIGFLKLDPRRKSMPSKLARNTPRPIAQDRLLNLSEDAAAKGYASKELIQPLPGNGVVEKNFSCVECPYQCSRVNVMLLHYKAHSRHFDHKIKYPTGFKRKKRNANVASSGASKKMKLTNGGEAVGKKVKSKAEMVEQQKQEAEKLKQNFLMDWEEEDNEEAEEEAEDSLEKVVSKEEEKASCFDFDDEEEEASSSKNSMSFTARKRQYSKSEESSASISSNGTKSYGKTEDKCDLADEVDALLNETKVPTLPDVPNAKGGDAITLPPPVEIESGFGTLTSDLNDSLDFRNDIVSKTSSTPAAGTNKLSKQTLKKNYFRKVREEIAEVAKFEEDEEDEAKQEEDFEDEDTDAVEDNEVGKLKPDKIPVKQSQPEDSPVEQAKPVAEPKETITDSVKPSAIVTQKNIQASDIAEYGNNTAPQDKTENITNDQKTAKDKILTKPVDKVKETQSTDNVPNIVQIGNQTIHIPSRRNSKTEVKRPGGGAGQIHKTESGRAEEERLAEMMLVEEVDLGRGEPLYMKQKPTSTVHIDMSPNEKTRQLEKSTKPLRGVMKTMPTIIPIETMHSKYKPINIPSTSTKQSPSKPSEEKFYILPNNQRIKTPSPAKSPAKGPIMLSSPDGGKILLSLPPSATSPSSKPHQSQVVYVSPSSKQAKPSNVPVITMKSTQKKVSLPVPGLRKITGQPDQAVQRTSGNPLQSKIKTIAHSNASQGKSGASAAKSSPAKSGGQGSILVNQSSLPSILQQRRSVQPTRVPPPALVTTPKLVQEPELLSEISNIPGADSSDSVVYLINNQQSQQILINTPTTGPETSAPDGQTIFIDPSATDLSNIYLTIDDDGNILNIVQKPDQPPCSDILAKALADTQVLQAECAVAGVGPSDPSYHNNTYETSLTLNQAPIMSTSEAPTQVHNPSYFSSAATVPPLIEIKSNQENVQGMASPEIGYTPSDIQA